MPGFTTHYIIGQRARKDLPLESPLRRILEQHASIYQLGVQGPDIFFYNVLLVRHRKYKNVGIMMHEFHVNAFIANLLDAVAKETDPENFGRGIAYTAGYICHYISDSIIHPYVYGRIGHSPKQKGRKKGEVTSLHCKLENDIDAIMLARYLNKRPSEFNQAATFSMTKDERRYISTLLCDAINRTYYPERYGNSFSITTGVVARSIWMMRIGCRALSDPRESKRRRLNHLENLLKRNPVASSKFVSDHISDVKWALNTMHEPWVNPWDRSKVSQESLQELFVKTLKKLHECYLLLDSLIADQNLSEADRSALLAELGNYSLHSGLSAG